MARKGGDSVKPQPSASLKVARNWVKKLGFQSDYLEVTVNDKKKGLLLLIHYGGRPVRVFDKGGVLEVSMEVSMNEKVIDGFNALSDDDKEKFELQLRMQLMSDSLTTYSVTPKNANGFSEIESITIIQTLMISGNDISTFNRFRDAVIAIVVVVGRLLSVLGILTPPSVGEPQGYGSIGDAPDSMYG